LQIREMPLANFVKPLSYLFAFVHIAPLNARRTLRSLALSSLVPVMIRMS
jgi:hypothetical protein